MNHSPETAALFSGLVDLASERVGGKALLASDEFFAAKENLLKSGRGMFIPDKYTDRGKWMDGWESRRKRTSGYDWCIIKLGFAGVIKGVDIDTNHFLGNNPAYASLEACSAPDESSAESLSQIAWMEVLEKSPIRPGAQNLFAITSTRRWTHVRLNIFPDGGVARLRIFGNAIPDWNRIGPDQTIDLAFVGNGGSVIAASDMFFGNKENLIMPGRALNMGDGWETRRRRGPGHDWVILKLAGTAHVERIEVDTDHFKGNFPDRCSIDCVHASQSPVDLLNWQEYEWKEILPQTKLQADTQHVFEKELASLPSCTHIRLNIYPDGGISRVRVLGKLV